MAGAGYKTFLTGDILTADDVQTYLMDQAVTTFATTTARDSAITSPSEGRFAYSLADDSYYIYSGTAWIPHQIAWKTYTPTITNVVLTNATITARYYQLGKVVHLHVRVVLGDATPVSGTPVVSLPITSATSRIHSGVGNATDNTNNFLLTSRYASTTTTNLYAHNVAGTYLTRTNIAAAVPFTWATGHAFDFNLTYEAA